MTTVGSSTRHREVDSRRFDSLHQPEIEQRGVWRALSTLPSRRQHHVPRLQISMHEAVSVGLVERVRDLHGVRERLLDRQGSPCETLRERLAFEVLHDEKVGAFVGADVVQRTDVRVIEARDRLCLALEALAERRIRCDVWREDLDGDGATEPGIPGSIDLPHPAGSQSRLDLVRSEARTDRDPHVLSRGIMARRAVVLSSRTDGGKADSPSHAVVADGINEQKCAPNWARPPGPEMSSPLTALRRSGSP